METRANAKVEVRTSEGGQKTLVGYASTFDHPYPVDMVTEIIDRKAFTRTLQEKPDVYALVGHDPARVLGRTKNGTLSLTVDERGLRCEIVPVDTQEARDVVALVESGTLDAMSFGFKVKDQKFEYRDGGVFRRIMDCELHEVSVVAFPANADAKLSMRDRAEVRSLLRKVGYRGAAEVRAIKFDLPNLGAEVTDIKLDINGNKTLYVQFYAGKRTKVQTNGNLPETHKMDIDSIDPRMVEQELSKYFDEIGYETPLKGARHQQLWLPSLLSDIAAYGWETRAKGLKVADGVPVKNMQELHDLAIDLSNQHKGKYILGWADFGEAMLFAYDKLPTSVYASDDFRLGYWRNGQHFDWSDARKLQAQKATDKLSGRQ